MSETHISISKSEYEVKSAQPCYRERRIHSIIPGVYEQVPTTSSYKPITWIKGRTTINAPKLIWEFNGAVV